MKKEKLNGVERVRFSIFNLSYFGVRFVVIVLFLIFSLVCYKVVFGNEQEYIFDRCTEYRPMIQDGIDEHGVVGFDTDFVCALIFVESSFDNSARSFYGAYGLMQITEHAWHDYVEMAGGSILLDETKNPASNISVGVWYLERLLKVMKEKYGDDVSIHATLTAYWRGIGKVRQSGKLKSRYSKKVLDVYGAIKRVGIIRKQKEGMVRQLRFFFDRVAVGSFASGNFLQAREEDFLIRFL